MPIRRLSCTGSTASSYTSAPSSSTRPVTQPPSDSSCIRFRHRRKVLLPQPDGPITAVTVWAGKRMQTSFTTARRPYRAVRRTVSSRSRASAGGAMALPDGPAGGDAEQQHQRHEHEGRGPREAVPLLERPRGVLVDLVGQGLHRLRDAGREVQVAERGEEQGRRLDGDGGGAGETAGDDGGGRSKRHDERHGPRG